MKQDHGDIVKLIRIRNVGEKASTDPIEHRFGGIVRPRKQ